LTFGKAINKIETALANYNTNISTLNLLQESQKIEEARYSAGVATLNDLLLAKAKTELTKSKLIESQYNYQNGIYYLDYLLEKGEERWFKDYYYYYYTNRLQVAIGIKGKGAFRKRGKEEDWFRTNYQKEFYYWFRLTPWRKWEIPKS